MNDTYSSAEGGRGLECTSYGNAPACFVGCTWPSCENNSETTGRLAEKTCLPCACVLIFLLLCMARFQRHKRRDDEEEQPREDQRREGHAKQQWEQNPSSSSNGPTGQSEKTRLTTLVLPTPPGPRPAPLLPLPFASPRSPPGETWELTNRSGSARMRRGAAFIFSPFRLLFISNEGFCVSPPQEDFSNPSYLLVLPLPPSFRLVPISIYVLPPPLCLAPVRLAPTVTPDFFSIPRPDSRPPFSLPASSSFPFATTRLATPGRRHRGRKRAAADHRSPGDGVSAGALAGPSTAAASPRSSAPRAGAFSARGRRGRRRY